MMAVQSTRIEISVEYDSAEMSIDQLKAMRDMIKQGIELLHGHILTLNDLINLRLSQQSMTSIVPKISPVEEPELHDPSVWSDPGFVPWPDISQAPPTEPRHLLRDQ